MPSSIMLVSGGSRSGGASDRNERRGDWAQALPLVLEKLGYLGVTVAGPSVLADPRTWERHAAVLVPALARDQWTDEALELVGSGTAQAMLELPPEELHQRVGILCSGPAPRFGVVATADPALSAAVSERSAVSSSHLQAPRSRPVDRAEDLHWARLSVPIESGQAERWAAPGWDVQRWAVSDGSEVLAEWRETGGSDRRWPAIVRRGPIVAACFSMFAYLGQQTTIQPFAGSEHLSWPRSSALEAVLSALLEAMHRRAGASLPRIMPWPDGATWALNVRHDFDRIQPRRDVDRVLAVHARAGTAATWYWRARHITSRRSPAARLRAHGSDAASVARRVARSPRQEVALHTERLWISAEEERRKVEGAIGKPVKGSSAHGDPNCFRWQGAPNVLWAERQGLDYTEFISHSHLIPHRFAALSPDGSIAHCDVICLPHHESLDRSTSPGDVAVDSVIAAAESYMRAGGMMQVLNHPDLNVGELTELLRLLPSEGRLDWTAAQVADWWRRTHVRSELELRQEHGGRITLQSARGVRGAVLEVLSPDGSRKRFSIDLDAGDSLSVDPAGTAERVASAPLVTDRWRREVGPAFERAARAYYADHAIDPDAESSRSTIAINSTLVPGRVDATRSYLAELGGPGSFAGLRVLDCGCGFGAFAAYLALGPGSPLVTSIDNRAEFVSLAEEVRRKTGLDGVDYQVGDMRDLQAFDAAEFDLVLVNNAFIYLPTKRDMQMATAQLSRVLSPGGHVFLFHANRWQTREPFTGDPIVHLLPARLATCASQLVGWRHNHGRVRLVSAPSLSRMLRAHGFERVRTGAPVAGRVVGPPRSYLARYYAAVARRAG